MSDPSTNAVYRDAFNMFCTKLIGQGMSRKVFSSTLMPNVVVKVEEDAKQFQNIVEWETWQRVKNTDASRWFAQCIEISADGKVLVMERTVPPQESEYLAKMPAYLVDFKRENYGVVTSGPQCTGKGTKRFLVCHDYGTNHLMEHGMNSKRMQKVDWWDL
jgi:hypothetical protein